MGARDRKDVNSMVDDSHESIADVIPRNIGVITPTKLLFESWMKKYIGVHDRKLWVRVSSIDDIRGREFSSLIEGFKYYDVHVDVRERAKLRISS